MSHIFEALQRAEEERTGTVSRQPVESVAELLHVADLMRAGDSEPIAILEPPAMAVESTPAPTLVAERAVSNFANVRVLTATPSETSRLVCLTDQGSLGAEKFRVLGLRLRHMREQRRLKRIVVTSTIPQEGKSLIAANLALNQARSKILKTVLIDADLRRPALGGLFAFHRNLPGLSECLRGECSLSDVVYKLKDTGLWFIPAGITPENPIELMQSGRMKELLEELETFFDWVIIDTPPILPLADTPLLAKLSDGLLMVIREGVCEKKQLERALESLDPSSVLGVVVNSCSRSELKYYYSRYSEATRNEDDPEPSAAG